MMIEIDHDFSPAGHVVATHLIDTQDAQTKTVFTAINGNAAAQAAAGYGVVSKHLNANPGETRWQFIKRQLTNVQAADPIKAIGLL